IFSRATQLRESDVLQLTNPLPRDTEFFPISSSVFGLPPSSPKRSKTIIFSRHVSTSSKPLTSSLSATPHLTAALSPTPGAAFCARRASWLASGHARFFAQRAAVAARPIATNVFFETTREWLVFPFLTCYYGNGGTKVSKKAERRLSLSSTLKLDQAPVVTVTAKRSGTSAMRQKASRTGAAIFPVALHGRFTR